MYIYLNEYLQVYNFTTSIKYYNLDDFLFYNKRLKRLYFDYLHQKISRRYSNTFKINKSKCIVCNMFNFNIGSTCIINISYDSPLEILKTTLKDLEAYLRD